MPPALVELPFQDVIVVRQSISSDPVPRLLEAPKAPPVPPILERIAWCESKGRQYDRHGNVLRGVNKNDFGKYQINAAVWGEKAERLGYDIMIEEGNEAMAMAIWREYNVEPWSASRHCWARY